MRFPTVYHAMMWYLAAKHSIYLPPSTFKDMTDKAALVKNTASAETLEEIREFPETQIVRACGKTHSKGSYCQEQEIIAILDIEKVFSRLPKIQRQILQRFFSATYINDKGRKVEGGMNGARIVAKRLYSSLRSKGECEARVYEIMDHFEEQLIQAGYVMSSPDYSNLDELMGDSEMLAA